MLRNVTPDIYKSCSVNCPTRSKQKEQMFWKKRENSTIKGVRGELDRPCSLVYNSDLAKQFIIISAKYIILLERTHFLNVRRKLFSEFHSSELVTQCHYNA